MKSKVVKLNKQERTFLEWLQETDFRLCKDDDGYYLSDLQGANLGGIEQDRFDSAAGILDRMDIYINDYLFRDLEEEASLYETSFKDNTPEDVEGWLRLYSKRLKSSEEDKKFFKTHEWKFKVFRLIRDGASRVNLEHVLSVSDSDFEKED